MDTCTLCNAGHRGKLKSVQCMYSDAHIPGASLYTIISKYRSMCTYFFWEESLGLATVLDLDLWLTVVIDNLEWPVLHVRLNGSIVEATTDQTLSI